MSTLVDRVGETAPTIRPGRALLTLLVGVFWLLGWSMGTFANAVAYSIAAVRLGYRDARPRRSS